jgi:hypothetical protein
MRNTDDLAFADGSEVAAVERKTRLLDHEKLTGEERKTPFPGRQRATILVPLQRLDEGLAVDGNVSPRAANSIAGDGNDTLEKRDVRPKNPMRDQHGFERGRRYQEDQIAAAGTAIFDAIPPDGSASGRVVDHPRSARLRNGVGKDVSRDLEGLTRSTVLFLGVGIMV